MGTDSLMKVVSREDAALVMTYPPAGRSKPWKIGGGHIAISQHVITKLQSIDCSVIAKLHSLAHSLSVMPSFLNFGKKAPPPLRALRPCPDICLHVSAHFCLRALRPCPDACMPHFCLTSWRLSHAPFAMFFPTSRCFCSLLYMMEGCVKRYQLFTAFQRHLDVGKHMVKAERETAFNEVLILTQNSPMGRCTQAGVNPKRYKSLSQF